MSSLPRGNLTTDSFDPSVGTPEEVVSEVEDQTTPDSYWYLRISQDEFKDTFNGKAYVNMEPFLSPPMDNIDLLENYLPSKLWRMNNLYTIVDKDANRTIMRMLPGQIATYAATLIHPRIIVLKSRQQGISTFWLLSFLDDAIFIPDLNIGLMSQGLKESATLLKRVKLAWDNFPEELKQLLNIKCIRENSGEIAFDNGSTIYIGQSFRSATLHRLHISEYGKICNKYPDRAIETKTGSMQAIKPGNTIVIESTAEGDNDFKDMWEKAVIAEAKANRFDPPVYAGKAYKPVFLSWLYDPDCVAELHEEETIESQKYFDELFAACGLTATKYQRNFWIGAEDEVGDKVKQEYPATPDEAFAKSNDGRYYISLVNKHIVQGNRIVPNLYDSNLEVNVTIDLGISESDNLVLQFWQVYDKEIRIIDEYRNFNEGLSHYVNYINDTGYYINWVVAPHDIKVRELGTGKSREDVLRDLGVKRLMVLPKLPVADGIELVRQMIPNTWIDAKCTYMLNCVRKYTKEWDEINKTWKKKPVHNEWSHGADCWRYTAMSGIKRLEKRRKVRGDGQVVDGIAM